MVNQAAGKKKKKAVIMNSMQLNFSYAKRNYIDIGKVECKN